MTWIAQIIWLNDWPNPIPENPAWFLVCRFGNFAKVIVMVASRSAYLTWLDGFDILSDTTDCRLTFLRTREIVKSDATGPSCFLTYILRKPRITISCRPPKNTNAFVLFHRQVSIFLLSCVMRLVSLLSVPVFCGSGSTSLKHEWNPRNGGVLLPTRCFVRSL